jgi:hypothetical protein
VEFFQKIDHIDCKNAMFEVMKRAFFAPSKIRLEILNPLGLKLALHKS